MKLTKAYRPGEIYNTNHGSLVIKSNSKRMNFRWVRFINTGFEREARIDHIKSGKVRDVFYPTVYGVGYLGYGPYCSKIKDATGKWKPDPVYSLWASMLNRCYGIDYINPKQRTYEHATVHSDWHNFQTFANDIHDLEGYSEWIKPDSDYQLDKDKYGGSSMIYSLENCCFVSARENQMLKLDFGGCIGKNNKAHLYLCSSQLS